jgi:hypothetical protein
VAGIILVGAFSAFAPSAARLSGVQDRRPVFAAASAAPSQPETGQENGSPGLVAVPAPTPAATSASDAVPTAGPSAAATSVPVTVAPTPVVPAVPSPSQAGSSGQGPVALASAGSSGSPESAGDMDGKNAGGHTEGTTPPSLGGGESSGGRTDARILAITGCALLLAAGLMLLIGPSLVSRRRRASR